MPDGDPNDCFSKTYAEARAAFLRACADSGAAIVSHRHPLAGPGGEPLFLDEARIGPMPARYVLFIASGTHGIEGFCGSGIQTFLLRGGLAQRLPEGLAVVLVHAVNPWGFAWLRRVNEDNADVNRNFLDHGAHPENKDYDGLHDALNPERLDDATVAASLATIKRFEDERGWEALYRALSGGQYEHPRGIQFGGREPVWSNRILRRLWERHTRRAAITAYVDLHSGLGPRGVGLLLQTAPEASTAAELAKHCWPDVIRSEPAQGSDAALASGLIGPAFVAAQPVAAATGLVLEFGTLDTTEVVQAMQADNWLHHHGRRDSAEGRAIEQRMRAAFFIEEADWKQAVCARAQQVIDAALSALPTFELTSMAAAAARVRPAVPEDAEVLVEFDRAMARETEGRELDPEALRAGTAALLADPERGRVFVIESAGEVVATLSLTLEWSNWRNGCFWWIQSVYVRPDQRRRGYYRRLHEHVVALAERDPEVCGIRLYVEHENVTAQRTYKALSMEETPYRIYEQPMRRSK
jgi:GNAT superfamily N-acetyltransferase